MMITVKCPECGESVSVASEVSKAVCRCGADLDPSSAIDPSSGYDPSTTGTVTEPPSSGTVSPFSAPSALKKRRRPTPATVPGRIGRYEVGPVIGRGAFGTVYLARDVNLDRQVALKVAHLDVVRNPDLIERFKKEAKVAAQMKHEGIVIVHDVDSWESWLYIATEYIEGRTLRELMREGPLPLPRAVRTAIALAQALSHAHLAGVTHRDVKPTNVMITPEGKVKLIDFGLVQLEESTQTREHALLGTVNYMSPEQAAGDNHRVKYSSDQYSLGVVLYEMLCGRPPYRGDNHEVLGLVASPRQVPSPTEVNPEIPGPLEAICLKALSKTIEGRYDSCRALAEALQKWLDSYERNEPGATAPPGFSSASDGSSLALPAATDGAGGTDLRTREPLRQLVRRAAERAGVEERDAFARSARIEAGRKDADRRRSLAKQQFDAEKAALVEAEGRRQRQTDTIVETELVSAETLYQDRCEHIRQQAAAYIADLDKKCEWSVAVATGVFEGKTKQARERAVAQAKAARRAHARLSARVNALAGRHQVTPTAVGPETDPAEILTVRVGLRSVTARLAELESRRPEHLLNRPAELAVDALVFLMVLLPASVVLGQYLDPLTGPWGARAASALVALGVAAYFDRVALRRLLKPRGQEVAAALGPLCQDLARLDQMIGRLATGQDAAQSRRLEKIQRRHDEAVRKAESRRKQLVMGTERWRAQKLEEASRLYRSRRDELRASRGADAGRARLASLERRYRKDRLAIDQAERANEKAIEADYLEAKHRLRDRWVRAVRSVDSAVGAIREGVRKVNPPWDSADWGSWDLPESTPTAVRFGEVRVNLALVPHGLPQDVRAHEGLPTEFLWPALLHLPDRGNFLVEAPPAARDEAVGVLQSVTLRILSSLPAGRVRLTIIDPLGLGGDFGAFLQLADYEAVLPPVLTDADKIERCLVDHLGHIKKVISYLRNDHSTVREYNERAGEVAEPFRLLVVSDFPDGFSAEAAARLAKIAAQGPRCGVLTLVAAPTDRTWPPGVAPADLAANAVRLTFKGRGFVWDDPDFGPFPLSVDPPPPPPVATRVLRRVGAAAEVARKVVVPFEFVAPAPEEFWTGDTASGVEIAIGKTGPSKAQALSLGKGTSQHVLIAGRTGSGKSSLFHALIVNLALKYGPDEIEFYLIDFKKGVEFKTYATHELPHARVIAVESEREFGLSVLRRLDQLLQDRGERFRQAGVHDMKGYRAIEGLPPLPRILLAVDEFQEFFIEDDALAGDANQYLDRLVRQGRAFGVHVVLGSQTLSGTYSLARSTLSQMGVRIALQCGAGDAHLILGEDNDAARLLSRPGEAVYNDANGLAEGNHFFQIVWLSEDRRDDYLRTLREFARRRNWEPISPQVVFEGNEIADLSKNPLLHARLGAPGWPESPRGTPAWVGEPVAIKGPTAVLFRRRAGDNLLVVGQDAEAAAGVLCAAVLAVAAQRPARGPGSAAFLVLDGVPEEGEAAGALARTCRAVPHACEVVGRTGLPGLLERLVGEVDRRLLDDSADGPTLFLLVNNLAAFREIRRDDSFDFSAGSREAARPSASFSKLLRSGPAVGVHVLAWCDTLNNLNRALDRNDQREFSARIAFQMSASDSSHFLDSPQASRLGARRALFVDEESGVVEKFRPYGPPPGQWLSAVREQLFRRAEGEAPGPDDGEEPPDGDEPAGSPPDRCE